MNHHGKARATGRSGGSRWILSTLALLACSGQLMAKAHDTQPSHASGVVELEQVAEQILLHLSARPSEAEVSEPGHRPSTSGAWENLGAEFGGRHVCGAGFVQDGKVLLLYGPRAPGQPAALVLADLGKRSTRTITSDSPQLQNMTLDQSNIPPVRLNVWVYRFANTDAFFFPVTSLQEATDDLLQTARFRLRIDETKIFELEYHSGTQAQAMIRSCMAER